MPRPCLKFAMASSTGVSPTEIATALQTLTPDEAKELFFYLKVPLHSLNSVPTNQSGNMAKISYIQLWYDNDHDTSWDRIVDGLQRIEKKTLAIRLASQYCTRTLTSADNFTLDLPSSPVSTLEASALATSGLSPTEPSLNPVARPSTLEASVLPTSGSSPTEPSLGPVARPSSPFDRVSEVRAEIDRLSDTFSDLVSDTRDEMCIRASVEPPFLNKFRDRLLDLPVAQKAPHTKFFRDNEDDFLKAVNMHKIFAILRRYSNYRNYAVLREVVRKFNSTMLQQRMNDYIKSLEHFEKATAVDVYLRAIEASDVLCAEFTKMIVKIDKPAPECTLYDIRKKTEEITERASLQSYSVYIGPVLEGSVVLALGFPANCVGWILGALTPAFLATHLLSDVVLDQQPLSILNWHQENLNDELLVASKEGDVVAVASLLNS
ncbi:hypothetical protein GBAR_LOCUS15269 [Geodia barretti]|uniref:Uncharacterized protein n=1 Tax=Geodia barretti TaxID=519541 RepID=A0AA35WU45_GEOBA|nr:hypothetical protein GBAR_LOCUS15269 [Geodia barretti]